MSCSTSLAGVCYHRSTAGRVANMNACAIGCYNAAQRRSPALFRPARAMASAGLARGVPSVAYTGRLLREHGRPVVL
jgi:hypothetical protein